VDLLSVGVSQSADCHTAHRFSRIVNSKVAEHITALVVSCPRVWVCCPLWRCWDVWFLSSTVAENITALVVSRPRVGLYKTLFYFEACVHDSAVLLLPLPTCIARTIAIRLHVYCAIIYDAPPPPLLYAIHHTILVIMAISYKSQSRMCS